MHHSRFCVAAGLLRRAPSKAVSEVLGASLARYEIPDEIPTDNGKSFTGQLGFVGSAQYSLWGPLTSLAPTAVALMP